TSGASDHYEFNAATSTLTWHGAAASSPVTLEAGALLRITYQTGALVGAETDLEIYRVGLPHADVRDPFDADGNAIVPPHNPVPRLIREDDAMFADLVTRTHPFADPVTFGWVRTEFPYSEQAYAMDEYNGSK